MIKPTVQIGNPIIRKKSSKVANFSNSKVKTTIRDLIDSMRKHELVGMAAPQIGVDLQIFVTELRKTKIRKSLKELDKIKVYINPKILSYSTEQRVM
jgi:peptide deformylase